MEKVFESTQKNNTPKPATKLADTQKPRDKLLSMHRMRDSRPLSCQADRCEAEPRSVRFLYNCLRSA